MGYLERKLNRAVALLDKPEDAIAELALAQSEGIDFIVNKEDDPLVEVQHALRLAERMVEEGKHEAANENLKHAQIQLALYRAATGKEAAKAAKQLEDEIAALKPRIKDKGVTEKIRQFWERAVSWIQEAPGQSHVVKEDSGESAHKELAESGQKTQSK